MAEIERLTETDLTTLARRVVTNEVFIANMDPALRYAFGLVAALHFSEWTEEQVKQVGALWEEYSKALPRTINGYPVFMSCHLLHADDLEPLREKIDLMQQALGVPS